MVTGVSIMPGFTIAEETVTFLQACLLGVGLAFLYDILRLFRFTVPCHTVFVFLQDIIYLAFVTLCTFCFILSFHDGKLRIFILLGEMMGAVVYFFTLSLLFMKVCKKIILWMKRFLKRLIRLVLSPFLILFRSIKGLFIIIGQKMLYPLKKVAGIAQRYLQNRKKLLYNKKRLKNREAEGGKGDGTEE